MEKAAARLAAVAVVAVCACVAAAAPVMNGDDGDWPETSRIHPSFSEAFDPAVQEALYMQADDEFLYFFLKAREGSGTGASSDLFAFTSSTTIYIDTDLNPTTGYSGTSAPLGFDVMIIPQFNWWTPGSFGANAIDVMGPCARYDGSCSSTLLFSVPTSEVGVFERPGSSFGRGVEFRLSRAQLAAATGRPVGDVEISMTLWVKTDDGKKKHSVVGPSYSKNMYGFYRDAIAPPPCTRNEGLRGAVVYSNLLRDSFYNDKNYVQLFMSMQHQMRQAGVPTDRIYLQDLYDYSAMCHMDVILLPEVTYVAIEEIALFRRALFMLVHRYGVGVVASGNVNAALAPGLAMPGSSSYTLRSLFGVAQTGAYSTTKIEVFVSDVSTSVFGDLALNQVFMDETEVGSQTSTFAAASSTSRFTVNAVARQRFDIQDGATGQEGNAILTSEIKQGDSLFGAASGRIAHIARLGILGNSNAVWRAVDWVVQGRRPITMGLQAGRFSGLFTTRVDCDNTRYFHTAGFMIPFMISNWSRPWYDKYGAVASYYINIGDEPERGRYTDWERSGEWYNDLLSFENEIGSHSYNHPFDISDPAVNLDYEFGTAQTVIANKLGLSRLGAAQPGATEKLWVAERMNDIMPETYFSGGYSGVRAGFPGAFGFLRPDLNMVYVAPNINFDFTLIAFQKMTAEQASERWAKDFDRASSLGKQPTYHWPIHDYAAGNWGYDGSNSPVLDKGLGYTDAMFTGVLEDAVQSGAEFLTVLDLADRIRAHEAARVQITPGTSASSLTVEVVPAEGKPVGRLALDLMQPNPAAPLRIHSVVGHYAFSDTKIFLPELGGVFQVQLGAGATPPSEQVTRVVVLPQRVKLLQVQGNGADINVQFEGRGRVEIQLNPNIAARSYSYSAWTEGVDTIQTCAQLEPASHRLALNFDRPGVHQVVVRS